MHEIRTETIINAPRELVWSILVDFNQYPHWNPFIPSVRTSLREGSKADIKVRAKGMTLPLKAVINCVRPQEEFRWNGANAKQVGWIIDGDHYFRLQSISENQTSFIHGEILTGFLIAPMKSTLGDMKKDFLSMNVALKFRAEKMYQNSQKSAS